jgi:endonuclease-8
VPEGDTIFRAARTLNRALAGRTVTRFESVFPALSRVDVDEPIAGRTIEKVEARGKHLLFRFSHGLILRTHMRMSGSWHIYRPHERWQRPHCDMRIVVETDQFHAVAFNVPVAEFATDVSLERTRPLSTLGPDPLSADFDSDDAVTRIMGRTGMQIADALLDQSAIAGIGNVYKSEVLFAGRVNPFAGVDELSRGDVERLVAAAVRFLRANVREHTSPSINTYGGFRRTTGRHDPGARLWVYGRAGRPCRRCGMPVSRRKQGPHARTTYWCAQCQPPAAT